METTKRNAIWHSIASGLLICSVFLLLPSCSEKEDWLSSEVNNKSLSIEGDLYYGPETFARIFGEPFIETRSLENLDFDCFDGNFILKIQNGNNKKTRVSSAEIWIDGLLIVGPSAFSQNMSSISVQLYGLTSKSILEVKLNGAPGRLIYLWIEGNLLEGSCCGNTIKDIDGNSYKTVKIGDQCWMAENLKTTTLNDGTPIILATEFSDWVSYIFEAPCYTWYNNDPFYKDAYGALYNNESARNDKLCPVGWHVSTGFDWYRMVLIYDPNAINSHSYMSDIAGGALKAMGTIEGGDGLWHEPNTGATNESGFSAIPGGNRNNQGLFLGLGYVGYWWMAGGLDLRSIGYNRTIIGGSEGSNESGRSIRCVKD